MTLAGPEGIGTGTMWFTLTFLSQWANTHKKRQSVGVPARAGLSFGQKKIGDSCNPGTSDGSSTSDEYLFLDSVAPRCLSILCTSSCLCTGRGMTTSSAATGLGQGYAEEEVKIAKQDQLVLKPSCFGASLKHRKLIKANKQKHDARSTMINCYQVAW